MQMEPNMPVPFAYLNELFRPTEGPAQGDTGPEIPPSTAQSESEKKMWTEYMKEAEKYDNRDAEAWKGDSDGILVFTGLFSATVGAFIIQFYNQLLPDSNNQTVDLLCQISQQLPNFTTGTCNPQAGQSFSPGASIIWVNSMWMMSLILSLTSALLATLVQQWARRYVQMPEIPSDPNHRARVRSYLFFGTRRYKMRIAIETAPTLLHFSVFLFFAGLVIQFFSINKVVAIIVSVSVGIFVAAYFVLTILPYIEHNCPYRTPMSNIWWYITHFSFLSLAFCFRCFLRRIHYCFVPYSNEGRVTSYRQFILVSVLRFVENAVEKHGKRLKAGFRETIVQRALKAADDQDVKALDWWLQLPALAEENKAQDFLACIPEKTLVQLILHPTEPRKRDSQRYLHILLRSCEPGSLAVGLNENERKTRLLVCLHAIHRITHAFVDQNSDVNVDFVRRHFANMGLMPAMWADSNVGIRITSRSICALLARCILRRVPLQEPEPIWLQDVIGEQANTIYNSDIVARDHMNLKAFVYGVLSGQKGDLPTEHATSFTETLAILMDAGTHQEDDMRLDIMGPPLPRFPAVSRPPVAQRPFDWAKFKEKLSALVGQIQPVTTQDRSVVGNLRRMYGDFLQAAVPVPVPAPGPGLAAVPVVELDGLDLRPDL